MTADKHADSHCTLGYGNWNKPKMVLWNKYHMSKSEKVK